MSYAFASDKVIPAWLQPAVILDLLQARGVHTGKILAESALLPVDMPLVGRRLSARQFERLLVNGERQWPGDDFAFQLGHRLYRQGLGPFSTLVQEPVAAADFVAVVLQFQRLIAPTLALWQLPVGRRSWFFLVRPGASGQSPAVAMRAAMTVISLLFRHNCPTANSHVFLTEPAVAVEHFHTHLGVNCHFSAPFNGLLFQEAAASGAVTTLADLGILPRVAFEHCQALCCEPDYFVAALAKQLQPNPAVPPDLQGCASAFGLSPATFKRRLREHGLSFQGLLDAIRAELAQVDLLINDVSVESLSERLHFYDTSNFRRAFKRWTGTTPALLKANYRKVFDGIH